MRIIAGVFKGRRLAPVKGRIRPTAAKVREAVFSILGPAVGGLRVLDLFAGTGALGIEALSRGAADSRLRGGPPRVPEGAAPQPGGFGPVGPDHGLAPAGDHGFEATGRPGRVFDLAFLDPPYGGPEAVAALTALAELPLLAPGARVVVEHSRREGLPEACGALTRLTVRRYGDTQVAFYLMAVTDDPLALSKP